MQAIKSLTVITGFLFWVPVWAQTAIAQPRAIDTAKSVMTVRVSKAGLLSGLGHDHEISAPIAGGMVDATSHRVDIHINAHLMRVLDPGISDKDRGEIQSNMLGLPVLDVEHFSEIVFRSISGSSSGNDSWAVNGELTLHGQHGWWR
jgi:polyisoprenoid-binding protein YceI